MAELLGAIAAIKTVQLFQLPVASSSSASGPTPSNRPKAHSSVEGDDANDVDSDKERKCLHCGQIDSISTAQFLGFHNKCSSCKRNRSH